MRLFWLSLPLCKIHGTAPITAILVLGISVALSTAIGTLAKEYVENSTLHTTPASFVLYLFIVFCGMILFYTLLFFCCSFGGGMLADPQHTIENSIPFYATGKRGQADIPCCCNRGCLWSHPITATDDEDIALNDHGLIF